MKYGYYSDKDIPKSVALDSTPTASYKINSYGYRCAEWLPLPAGKKNVVLLGCSHTFGEGLDEGEGWTDQLYNLVNQKLLRFWNLGQPGASADKIVRILYGCEKILFPKIIIVCWPAWNRRERLDVYPQSLTSDDDLLKNENENTDRNNFLKNVFFVEKFAEKIEAKVLHCFAQDVYELPNANNVFSKSSIKLCWPEWSTMTFEQEKRVSITKPSLARDGIHYGVEHHQTFAKLFYNYFKKYLN